MSNSENEEDLLKSLSAFASYDNLQSSVNFEIDKAEELSNGDKITVTITWDNDIAKENGLKFSGESKEIEVTGLKKSTSIDLFADVHMEYSETSPNAVATVRNASNDAFIKNTRYSIDNSNALANGDTITVTASFDEYEALEKGYIPKEITKTYTVENVDEYIKSFDQITAETYEKMSSHATDIIESEMTDKYDAAQLLHPSEGIFGYELDELSVESIVLKENIFFLLKEGFNASSSMPNNSMFMVYEIHAKDERIPEGFVTYVPIYFKNFILSPDGIVDVIVTDAYLSTSNSQEYDNLYRDIVTSNKAEYEFEIVTAE